MFSNLLPVGFCFWRFILKADVLIDFLFDCSFQVKDESGFEVYTPDFYDNTDFECILTNLELEKLGRDRYGLPLEERQRTENILRRAIEAEKGVVVSLNEEHPDGLDISLFHDESQLKRKSVSGDDSDSSEESDSDSQKGMANLVSVFTVGLSGVTGRCNDLLWKVRKLTGT